MGTTMTTDPDHHAAAWNRCTWHAAPRRAQLRTLNGTLDTIEAGFALTSAWATTPPLTAEQWATIGRTNGRVF